MVAHWRMVGYIATTCVALTCLFREPVIARLNRARRLLDAPVDSAHAQLLANVLEEGGWTLATWHNHEGDLDDARVIRFAKAWQHLISYERALWTRDRVKTGTFDCKAARSVAPPPAAEASMPAHSRLGAWLTELACVSVRGSGAMTRPRILDEGCPERLGKAAEGPSCSASHEHG